MQRADLAKFVWQPSYRLEFLKYIEEETQMYGDCIKESGKSCPITVTGEGGCELTVALVSSVAEFFERSGCRPHVSDYVLTALQMDDLFPRSKDADELLDQLTS